MTIKATVPKTVAITISFSKLTSLGPSFLRNFCFICVRINKNKKNSQKAVFFLLVMFNHTPQNVD